MGSPLLSVLYLFLCVFNIAEAVLVNITVDDSLPDPLTGRLITYLPDSAWKAGVVCTDCTANVDGGSMFDRTWHDGTYFPANSNLPPTGPLNASFTFNGTAIYVFCALALSLSSPTGYSNMTFFIDNELVGQFERIPPDQQGYQYNVSVYANTSIPAGEHTFMLQNGEFGDLGNKSLTLFDYLVYSYDDGNQAPTSTLAATSSSVSASSSPAVRSSRSSPAGGIAGGVVGGIAGLLVLGLLLWFLRRRRSRTLKLDEKNHSNSPIYPNTNNTIPEPFTDSDHRSGPSASSTGYPQTPSAPSVGYGFGVTKNAQSQQRYITPSNASSAPSSSVNPSSSGSPPPSAGVPGRVRQRELDAGPVVLEGQGDEEEEGTLPPEYGQVFANANAGSTVVSSPRPFNNVGSRKS